MSADTKVLYVIPGFRHQVGKDMPTKFVRYLLEKEAASVTVAVLWIQAAGWYNANYNHAAISVWPVGNVVAYVNNELYLNGIETRTRTYCIGQRLGAHVCGCFGKRATSVRSTFVIQKIIGIDPAGPTFQDEIHLDTLRLAKGDAHEVEVWHTNSNYLGIKRPIGDIDFYINGGSKQPDCPGVMEYCLGICSHNRGFYLLMFLMKHNKKCYGKWGCTNHNHIGDVLAKINKELTPTLTAAGCQEYLRGDYRRNSWVLYQGMVLAEALAWFTGFKLIRILSTVLFGLERTFNEAPSLL